MKSFQDYLSLKEVSAVALGKELLGTKVNLSTEETDKINQVFNVVEEILAGPKAPRLLTVLENMSDGNVQLDPTVVRRAANKLRKAKMDQTGLGSVTGSEDEIATNSADRTTSNF
jgi:hypothetical protein